MDKGQPNKFLIIFEIDAVMKYILNENNMTINVKFTYLFDVQLNLYNFNIDEISTCKSLLLIIAIYKIICNRIA